MVNLQALNGISFKKGCYTGQETVARMRYLGKNKRAMFVVSGTRRCATTRVRFGTASWWQLASRWKKSFSNALIKAIAPIMHWPWCLMTQRQMRYLGEKYTWGEPYDSTSTLFFRKRLTGSHMIIAPNSVVTIHYSVQDKDKNTIDSTFDDAPISHAWHWLLDPRTWKRTTR